VNRQELQIMAYLKIIRIKCLLHLVIFIFIVSCSSSDKYPSGDYNVMIISDTHISNDEEKDDRLDTLLNMVNAGVFPGIDFVVNTGDVVSSVYKKYDRSNPEKSYNRLLKTVQIFNQLEIPYYFTMGNHDYKIDSDRDSDGPFNEDEIVKMEKIWKDFTGFEPYFSIIHKSWKFIFLNSMRGRYLNRHFDDKQLDWLEIELASNMPTILFFHHPLKTDNFRIWCGFKDLITQDKELRFYSLIQSNKKIIKAIFVGHGHMWVNDVLFETIAVYETNSFADESDLTYQVVGFDTMIHTFEPRKYPMPIDRE
jgi:predicted MPP superfamily phosphohydrolase